MARQLYFAYLMREGNRITPAHWSWSKQRTMKWLNKTIREGYFVKKYTDGKIEEYILNDGDEIMINIHNPKLAFTLFHEVLLCSKKFKKKN